MPTPTNEQLFQEGLQPSALMSPMEAAALLEAAAGGDTTNAVPASVDTGASPDAGTVEATPAAAATPTPPAAAPAPAATPAAPAQQVVMAGDNVHTIPFSVLEKTRADLAAAQAELETLRQQSAAAAAAGQSTTKVDAQIEQAQAAINQGIDPKLFGDWSPEAMAEGIAKAIELGTQKMREEFQAQVTGVKATTDSLAQAEAKKAWDAHYGLIYAAHKDANSIYESKELQDWINTKPGYMQQAMRDVFNPEGKATAQDVVDFISQFKAETGLKQQPAAAPTPAVDARTAANAAIAAAKDNTVPASLSHINGASPGPGSVFEAMDAMSGPALAEALEGMTKAQREAYLNRTG